MNNKDTSLAASSSNHSQNLMNRRSFISSSLCAAAGLLLPGTLSATPALSQPLCFYHTHTGEKMEIDYRPGGYKGEVKRSLESFLRDFRTGEQHALDPALFDSLYNIQKHSQIPLSFEVISAYRSPRTNAKLRKNSSGVASKSWHMQGRAIDIRARELPTKLLRKLALQNHQGGVGYYPTSNFIHLDTGQRRSW